MTRISIVLTMFDAVLKSMQLFQGEHLILETVVTQKLNQNILRGLCPLFMRCNLHSILKRGRASQQICFNDMNLLVNNLLPI